MRLAIVRRRFASAGGAERFIFETAVKLREIGAEVTLVAEAADEVALGAQDWLRLPAAKGSRTRRYRAFQKAAAQALAENRFDIVQAHERMMGADIFRAGDGVHAAWVERLKRERHGWRAPLIGLDPYHRLMMDAERRMAQQSDTIFVANSAMVQREISHWLKVPATRVRLIENGVDLDAFRPASESERQVARAHLGLGEGGPIAAFVGSGFERKGAFALVQALAEKGLGQLKLVIAGRDKRAAALTRLARRIGVADRVVQLGAVEDVRPVLHAADLFVLPTLYDPMPNAALEAIACGLPVVTTTDAGVADHIRDSGAGALSTRDPADIARAIGEVLSNLVRASDAAEGLRPRFDINWKTQEWLKLYRDVAG